jgi:2'-5' RNA ligase
MRRLFVAIEPDGGVRALAVDVAAGLRRELSGRARLDFTPSERQHVTLAFLGEVAETQLEVVNDVVANLARRHAPIVVEAGGVGAFPRPECARVLWLAFGHGSDALRSLALDLQTRLRAARHAIEDRDWTGHVTLARCRDRAGVDAREALARCTDRRVRCPVESLVVMESRQGAGGATYVSLFAAALRSDSAS